MVPLKSSPNELALTITRYRKSKLSSLVEKFTRHSPSSKILAATLPPPSYSLSTSLPASYEVSFPFPSFGAVYQSNFNLSSIVRAHTNVSYRGETTRNRTNLHRCWKTNSSPMTRARVRTYVHTYRHVYASKRIQRETVAELRANNALLLFSVLYKSLLSKRLKGKFSPLLSFNGNAYVERMISTIEQNAHRQNSDRGSPCSEIQRD